MSYKVKKQENSTLEIEFSLTLEDYRPFLSGAADRLSARAAIKGFRPGKVPYEVVEKELGAGAILNEALNEIVRAEFVKAVKAENLETVGEPKMEIKTFNPGAELVFVAVVAVLPEIKLPNFKKIKLKKVEPVVEEKKVEETLEALRGSHAEEIVKDGPAGEVDKLVIDLKMFVDKVPVDGGQSPNYQVYLSEKHYIPGFNEQLIGLKAGEEKKFRLSFSPDHYQKFLAGKDVDFEVKVKSVFERRLPPLTDELANKVGQKTVADLTELIRKNIRTEAEQKAKEKNEIALLDTVIAETEFSVLPEVIIESELERIFYELKDTLSRQQIAIEDYLADLKKTEEDLRKDFRSQAEKRAKAALVSRELTKKENLAVSDADLAEEIKKLREFYSKDAQILERLKRDDVQNTVRSSMQNQRVIKWLSEMIFGDK